MKLVFATKTLLLALLIVFTPHICALAQEPPPEEPVPTVIQVTFDIKPGSCVNPLNVWKRGVTPAAILGAEGFDVTTVKKESIKLIRTYEVIDETTGEPVEAQDVFLPSSLRLSVGDVASTQIDAEGNCVELAADGIPDLLIKFKTPEMVEALGLAGLANRSIVTLTLEAELTVNDANNTAVQIQGEDSIKLINNKK